MRIRNNPLLLLAFGITVAMAAGCASRSHRPIALVPALPPPPPPTPPSALTSDIPLRPFALPSSIGMTPEPRFDPVEDLVLKAQAAFARGEKNYNAGHMEMAKGEFNAAISTILQASPELREDKRIQKTFDTFVDRIHAYELEALKQGDGFTEPAYQPAPLDELQSLTVPENLALSERIREEAAHTVSDIPLVVNGQVAKFVEYFSSGRGRSALEFGLRNSGRFRDMILRILDEEKVPHDLLYLAQAESAFQPRARSNKAAVGIWQFVAATGAEYGLDRSWWSDERMNPEEATRAAARHLRDLYNMFGDWYLAMAAYNCGPVCVQRAVERTGYADFWQLSARRALPEQTRLYVPIILALTFIGKNADKYGLDTTPAEDPWVYDTATVTHPVDLRLVAEIVGTSVETIRELNPSLLRMTTPNIPEYTLRIPLATREIFLKKIALIPPEKRVWWRWHTVHYGETLTGIAQKYRTTVKAIAEVNNLDSDEPLQEAAELVIPVVRAGDSASGEIRYQVRANDTLASIARRYRVTTGQIIAWNRLNGTQIRRGMTLVIALPEGERGAAPASRRAVSGSEGSADPRTSPANTRALAQRNSLIHQVQKGESLWQIASLYNVSVEAIRRSNSQLGETLRVGDRLTIPTSK